MDNISVTADMTRANMTGITAVTASISGGFAGVSGGGVDIRNTIDDTVNAYLGNTSSTVKRLQVTAGGDVTVFADENAYVTGDATGVTAAISLGGAIGVGLIKNKIQSDITASLSNADVASTNTSVTANSVANIAKTMTVGVSASLVGAQGNQATAEISTLVSASTSNAMIGATDSLTVRATGTNTANTDSDGGAFGAIAVGAMVADVTLGRGQGVDAVLASLGASTQVVAQTVTIAASSADDLLSEQRGGGRRRDCGHGRAIEYHQHPGGAGGTRLGFDDHGFQRRAHLHSHSGCRCVGGQLFGRGAGRQRRRDFKLRDQHCEYRRGSECAR